MTKNIHRFDMKLTSTICRPKFIYITYKDSATQERTKCASITKTKHLTLGMEITALYCGDHMENVGKNAQLSV